MACMNHLVIPGHGGHVRPSEEAAWPPAGLARLQPGSSALSEERGRGVSGAWRGGFQRQWGGLGSQELGVLDAVPPGQGSGSAWLLWELPDPQSRGSVSKSGPESCQLGCKSWCLGLLSAVQLVGELFLRPRLAQGTGM